ncbi:chlorophyll a-b binding CP24 10A, chloroplastic [Olea europaea subsp. europaea]|uniref:Chlorophyll a-b binding protein, chloroplastic n=1 Tax=Olea europaea subsp. europaea TaxID=158383 RepID=A0A8S0P9C1_OLEEU|nr:chlorophyll a-b binding CP24 10A, chloroplastic [Olea europaea subsp. europaea]
MVSTSSALVNGLGSAFLNGGKNSQIFLSAPIAARTGGSALSPKRFTMVAAAAVAPKKSWIPAVKDLGKDPAFLKRYREAELIHDRWAMAAVVGIFVGQAWIGIPWFEAGATPGAVSLFSFGSLIGTQLLLMDTLKDGVYIPDTEKLERLKLVEIKQARLAMLAMLKFYFEAGQGKTPLGALGP